MSLRGELRTRGLPMTIFAEHRRTALVINWVHKLQKILLMDCKMSRV